MNRNRPHRPSLKITRHAAQTEASSFGFEVWSPFTANYQKVDTIEDGLRRIGELADLICQMWVQRHPKQDTLADAPDAGEAGAGEAGAGEAGAGEAGAGEVGETPGANEVETVEWAEFRINATTFRSYDTRRSDRPNWMRATGMVQAAEATCSRVGYVRAMPGA